MNRLTAFLLLIMLATPLMTFADQNKAPANSGEEGIVDGSGEEGAPSEAPDSGEEGIIGGNDSPLASPPPHNPQEVLDYSIRISGLLDLMNGNQANLYMLHNESDFILMLRNLQRHANHITKQGALCQVSCPPSRYYRHIGDLERQEGQNDPSPCPSAGIICFERHSDPLQTNLEAYNLNTEVPRERRHALIDSAIAAVHEYRTADAHLLMCQSNCRRDSSHGRAQLPELYGGSAGETGPEDSGVSSTQGE